jgi:hypothetical protein
VPLQVCSAMAHSEVKQKRALFSTYLITVTVTLLGFRTKGTRYTSIRIIIETSGNRSIISRDLIIHMFEYFLYFYFDPQRECVVDI